MSKSAVSAWVLAIGDFITTAIFTVYVDTSKAIKVVLWVITALLIIAAIIASVGDKKEKTGLEIENKVVVINEENKLLNKKDFIRNTELFFLLNLKAESIYPSDDNHFTVNGKDMKKWKSIETFKTDEDLYNFHMAVAYYEERYKKEFQK